MTMMVKSKVVMTICMGCVILRRSCQFHCHLILHHQGDPHLHFCSQQHQCCAATIPPASEINATTHPTTPLHAVPALHLTSKEVHLESSSYSSHEILNRVWPRGVIKQKVWDDQAMSDEEGCANSDCDDPSCGGKMVHCAGLSCP